MPTLQDFLDQLHDAGVHVAGEQLTRLAGMEPAAWAAELVALAQAGRKHGVAFTRRSEDDPSDERLHAILAGYPFSEPGRHVFVQNVVSRAAP